MRKFILTTVIALFVVSVWLYAQEKDTAQGEPKVKLELVYKKELGELMAGPEGFPPPEIRQILEDKEIPQEDKDWLLNSLRIEIARREKVLYINDGKAIKLPDDLQSITTSQNLKYMIVYAAHTDYGGMTADEVKKLRDEWLDAYKRYSQWQTKWERETEKKIPEYRDSMHYWLRISDSLNDKIKEVTMSKKKEYKKFIMMETEDGKVLWEREDMEPPRYISNDGRVAVGVPGYHFFSSVIFYDEHGNEIKKVSGLWGPQGSHDMSADGEMFCALTKTRQNDTAVMAVVAYDRNGNKLWGTELRGNWPHTIPCIGVSPNHKYVAASVSGIFLLNEKGVLVNTYNHAAYYPAFSYDGRYLILRTHKDTTYFVRTDNGEILWQKVLGGHSYKKPIVSKGGRAIFFISQVAEHHPAYLLDVRGNIIWDGSHELKNAIGLSPSGYFFLPSSEPELLIYKISSEVSDEEK
ncbi:MAG: hypothetical protein ABIL70_07745 [candidate division WOR-3 bacterium]